VVKVDFYPKNNTELFEKYLDDLTGNEKRLMVPRKKNKQN